MMIAKIVVTAIFLIIINITDVREFKIKNKTVVPFMIIGIIIGIINKTVSDSLTGLVLPLLLFPLFALKMLGAGDIKALCAIGAVVGFKMSLSTMIFTFLAGGVIGIGFMAVNSNLLSRIKYLGAYLRMCFLTRTMQKYDFGGYNKSYFRFAYAITAGTILMFVNEFVHIVNL